MFSLELEIDKKEKSVTVAELWSDFVNKNMFL